MSESRARILGAIRASLASGRGAAPEAAIARLRPARARGDRAALVERFVEMAGFAGATVSRVAGPGEVPGAVAAFLSRNALGDALVLAPDPGLSALPWHARPRLVIHRRAPEESDRVSLTTAVCGVAETGTILVRSGPGHANALHFLVEAHVVVLDTADIVGAYEDGWARLGVTGDNALPRAATFVTGPSRTADIEKTPQIGVHGPKRLHIVLVDGEKT